MKSFKSKLADFKLSLSEFNIRDIDTKALHQNYRFKTKTKRSFGRYGSRLSVTDLITPAQVRA